EFFRTQVPYGEIIYREARRNQLPPELVAAVVEAESDFRPKLVSHRNAQGLMQIVPDTGRILGVANAFDPEENIAAGTRYLRYLVNRFEDQRLALAAYNAGEGNVTKFGGVPPFEETLAYLDRVSARSSFYRQRVHNTWVASARTARATQ
ncbi:MAG TPA: lytic transglycosylase domain-containing protein, partial [Thermoanaerobaculia bacterium]|nr:lytic transglycosylase domain-containing protein [Thermoanaerobaculia bacterium]